jgi:(p)ppGpp synthase/HD superfamily hydrolase
LRKDDRTPYVSHVFRVAAIVRNVFGFDDPRMLATAVLHDTLEDTKTDFDDLEKEFGPEVAQWVSLLSKDKRLPELQREEAYMAGLRGAPWQVQVCKLADVYDNVLDSEGLSPQGRRQVLQRASSYVQALERTGLADTKKPLETVKQLMDQIAAKNHLG